MKVKIVMLLLCIVLSGCNPNESAKNKLEENTNKKFKVTSEESSSFEIPDTSKINQSYAYTVSRDAKNNKQFSCDLLAHLDDFYSFQASVYKLNSYYIKMGKECGNNQVKFIEVTPKSLLGNRKELKRYRIGKVKWDSSSAQCDAFFGKPFKSNEGERCYRYNDYEIVLSFKKDKVNFMGIYHKNKEEALKAYQKNNFVMQGCRLVKYTGNYNGKKIDLPKDIVSIEKSAFELKKSKEPTAYNEYNKNPDGSKVQKISISIPSYVHIEPKAFYKSGPIDITLEEGRKEVEPYAFWDAALIDRYGHSVRLPKSITRIRECAFMQSVGSAGNVSLYMGDNIKRMDDYALYGVVFDKLPENLENIGNNCIRIRCQKEKLIIPQRVRKLGYNPISLGFSSEDEKLGIMVDKKNKWFKSDKDGNLNSKDGHTLYFTYETEKKYIPKSVKNLMCELYS
ncbi:leucine-rich repeat protein [Eubacterium xylanophilum]|uniref:leucine-rich repeat protein n=1 Tax=Eubacterium xylanophilum TaxID=39497 RepID=UPI00047CBBF8|nr:leucine-rich repeat protein [Eubacterium xylanophilum]